MIRHVETPLGHGSNAYPPKRRVRRGSDEPDAPGQEHLRGVTGEPSPMSRKDSAPARLQPLAQIEDQHSGQLLMRLDPKSRVCVWAGWCHGSGFRAFNRL